MAAWLTWLKSRLLVPALGDPEDAETAAETLAARLIDLQAIRAASAWLGARPQAGWNFFLRGTPEDLTETDRSRLRVDLSGLLSSYLAARRRAGAKSTYTPKPMTYFSVQNALARLARLLGTVPDWSTLQDFLPPDITAPLARNAALSATLIASLEMAKDGALLLRQDHHFAPIMVKSVPRPDDKEP
jgi:segregation and condensation protein A